MKGNFSRRTFDRKKHYTEVLMQQGRVQVDADWNEQQAIYQHRIETEARDVIGSCGTPVESDGFKISVQSDNSLLIGKGRFYVDGILCENEEDVLYEKQPYLPHAVPPDVVTLLEEKKAQWAIVYLDVWKRHITALDDTHIREVALGGPDTASRVQTVWQVGILPVIPPREDTSSAHLTCLSQSDGWDQLIAPSTGTLNARAQPLENPTGPCLPPPSAGYLGLENQLYRVEIHISSDAQGGPTFKWSRENGSVVTTVEKFNGTDLTVHDVGPDDILGFAAGQWAEVIDDEKDLKGLPGELALIKSVDATRRVITMETAPTTIDLSLHPKLRRWEQMGPEATPDGVKMTYDWQALEDGIEVLFSQHIQETQATYKTGDYWLIPARTVTGDIEWPPYEIPNVHPIAQPPVGIHHHYCRLGLLQLDPRSRKLHLQDCRKRFPPLTGTLPAMHVIKTNWNNDDFFPPEKLLKDGLQITLDAAPEQHSVSPATVIVTLEIPATVLASRIGTLSGFNFSLIINGVLTVESNVIHWTLPTNTARVSTLETLLNTLSRLTAFTVFAVEPIGSPLIRVTLKGHDIWSNQGHQRYYLDGQAFGQPALRSDGKTPRTDLLLPSGAGIAASDFESWFYLGEVRTIPLRISTIKFISSWPGQPERVINPIVDLSQVPLTSTTPPTLPNVQFDDTDAVNVIEIAFTRAVTSDGIKPNGQPQSLTVTPQQGARVAGDIEFTNTNNNVVRFIARDFLGFSVYTLTVFGSDRGTGPAIRAQDDGALLDGNFDGRPGGDFVLSFEVINPIS